MPRSVSRLSPGRKTRLRLWVVFPRLVGTVIRRLHLATYSLIIIVVVSLLRCRLVSQKTSKCLACMSLSGWPDIIRWFVCWRSFVCGKLIGLVMPVMIGGLCVITLRRSSCWLFQRFASTRGPIRFKALLLSFDVTMFDGFKGYKAPASRSTNLSGSSSAGSASGLGGGHEVEVADLPALDGLELLSKKCRVG